MSYKGLCVILVFTRILTACVAGGQDTVVPENLPPMKNELLTQDIAATPTETPTMILPPMPSATWTPAATHTSAVTADSLAESGSDIADVRISYSDEDIVNIDFKYRVDAAGKRPSERIVIILLMPSRCNRPNDNPILTDVYDTVGQGRISYRQTAQGTCEVPYFDLAIKFWLEVPGNITLKDIYQERIDQPITVTRNAPSITWETLAVKNFSFQATGGWKGKLTFDYAFSPEIPITGEQYRFELSGNGDVYVCEFHAWGAVIREPEGTYTIEIDLETGDNFRISDPGCVSRYSVLTYDKSSLYLRDMYTGYPDPNYRRAVDLVLTFKKSP